jgi:mRNA interferase RelE/StbE
MSKKRNGRAPRPEPRKFEVQLTRAAERVLIALDKSLIRRLDAAICRLAVAPHPAGSKKLQGADDLYRIRVGDYRVIYQVDNELLVVTVVIIGHRRDVYRGR